MDVKCERCNTEYEFDDALVSGRGTTVKCTNCGHKFKIRRGDGDSAGDYWNVTTGDGRTLVFTSLRELQRAIQGYLVERTDKLSRGGLPPKPIGQIPELAPFFDQREAAKQAAGQSQPARKTQDGIGPGGAAAPAGASQPPPMRPRQMTKPEFPGPPPLSSPDVNTGKNTLIGTGPLTSEEAIPRPGPPPPPPRPAPGALKSVPPPVPARASREAMNTLPLQRPSVPSMPPAAGNAASGTAPPLPERALSAAPPTPSPAAVRTSPPPPVLRTNPPPPPPRPSRQETLSAPPVPSLAARSDDPPRRSLLAEIEDERRPQFESVPEFPTPKARRPVGGFIVAVVVLIGLAGLGAVWAQKNLGALTGTKPVTSAPAADPRVAGFLVAGEKALADGNLEVAKDSFDNARHLAEKDPHVLLALARLAAVRADVPWLKQRLLGTEAVDEQRIAKNELAELAAIARRTADDALAAAPEDPAALRAKVDALRIADDRGTARALVGKISASASNPETAYVLAALDLADAEPLWSQLVEKLKAASSVETGPGRGRAALVYALARSGDLVGAKAEVDRLSAMPRTHPLLPQLRAFAEHAKPGAKADAGVAAEVTKPAVNGGGTAPVGGGGGGGGIPSDPREMIAQAEKARNKGDYDRAHTLYNAAIEKNPNDSEALNGLAVLAYQQRDLPAARAAYKRVLAINPNFMPALIGAADVEWDSGDHATATKMYKEIVDRYPENAYPARVKQRSEG